eukprot:5854044-Prymnesium_polylepis.1
MDFHQPFCVCVGGGGRIVDIEHGGVGDRFLKPSHGKWSVSVRGARGSANCLDSRGQHDRVR